MSCRTAVPLSYQPLLPFTIFTTDSMTGTSTSTPTTVASAAPDSKPNRTMAVATASSKKLLAPIRAEGAATQCATPKVQFKKYARPELK
jgi:hypothetical protein